MDPPPSPSRPPPLPRSTSPLPAQIDDVLFCTGYYYRFPFLAGDTGVVHLEGGDKAPRPAPPRLVALLKKGFLCPHRAQHGVSNLSQSRLLPLAIRLSRPYRRGRPRSRRRAAPREA